MKKIAVILPRGEAIKNFVYSGITDELRKDFKVDFFSVVPNNELKKYLIDKCDSFYELAQEKESLSKKAKQYSEILKIAHAKKLNSVTGNLKILKDDLSSKKSLKSNFIRKIRKLIASFYKSENSLRKLTAKVIKSSEKDSNVIYYQKLLEQSKPDIVFNTSHIHNKSSFNVLFGAKKTALKNSYIFIFLG